MPVPWECLNNTHLFDFRNDSVCIQKPFSSPGLAIRFLFPPIHGPMKSAVESF